MKTKPIAAHEGAHNVRQPVDGVLLLDKPYGLSSNSALQQARRLLNAAKAGHTGVLDPLATGLLPICLGNATKFCAFLLAADKSYTATVSLGKVTTTADAEGEILLERPVNVTELAVHQVLTRFTGEIVQVPPMYSALKFQGKALYRYAREGIEVERQPRKITIYSIELLSFDGRDVVIHVHCSKGTYIRMLAQDIGEMLGCGAHLTALRRITTAGLTIEKATTLETLASLPCAHRESYLLPVDVLVYHLPMIWLPVDMCVRFCYGQAVRILKNHAIMALCRVYREDTQRFLGLAEYRSDNLLHPVRLVTVAATV